MSFNLTTFVTFLDAYQVQLAAKRYKQAYGESSGSFQLLIIAPT